MSDEQHYVAVSVAGKHTGIPERTIRHWLKTGKLSAIAGERGRLVRLEDVHQLAVVTGKLPGPLPGINLAATMAGNSADSVGNIAEDAHIVEVAAAVEHQLEVIRDTLLRPLIEQNERQQATMTEQAETIGKVTAERDNERRRREAVEARLGELQPQHAESLATTGATPETATRRAWWRFWEP